MKEKILKWCLPGFYIIGILGAVIYGIDYFNELKKQKERLLTLEKTLEVEEVGQLVQLELNSQNKNENVVYEVKDPSVVEVTENGNLISVGKGTTTITVTNEENTKTQTLVVGVGEEAIEEIKNNKEKVEQLIEENKTLLPSTNTNTNKNESTLNKEPEITEPQNVSVTGIGLDKTNITLNFNESTKLTVTISPSNATNKNVSWSTTNSKLVSVDSEGNIKAVGNKNGKATITVTSVDGYYKASMAVTVKAIDTSVKVTGISLDTSKVTLNYNSSTKLTATISPANATNKNVKWTSSNSKLVSVDNKGNIKAVGNKNGKATITATTIDGSYKASMAVTVKAIDTSVKVTGVNVSAEKVTLKYGENYKLNAEVLPVNATNKKVTWSSSDTNLVTVDNQGNVIAKSGKVGITTLEVKTQDGGYSKKIDVVVVPTGNYISFSGGNYKTFVSDIVLDRAGAIMQSFAIYNNNIYISQQQAGASGAYFSRIDKSNYDSGKRKFTKNVSILVDGGHAGNMDIEVTNNVAYLWTSCGQEIDSDSSQSFHCRIPLNSLTFGDRVKFSQENVPFKKSGGVLVAVDDVNRTIVVMFKYTMYVYNLDDYLNGNARLISKFKVNSKSRQGFDVHGNYIYVYEGITAPLLSIYTLSGEMLDKQYITKPDSVNSFEAEGVKIYNNEIYIGMAKKADKKTANIYILN